MLYNTFVSLIIGISLLVVFGLLYKMRREKKVKFNPGIDYWLLGAGLLWILVGIRIFFTWLGRSDLDFFTWYWFTGPLTYIHMVPLFYYFGTVFFKKKSSRLGFDMIFTLITLVILFTLFKYGSSPGEITYWGTKPVAADITHKLLTFGILIPITFYILIDLIRRLRNWKKTGNLSQKQLLLFDFGLLIYILIGALDALAIVHGWTLLLARTGIMVSAFIIYFSATIDLEE